MSQTPRVDVTGASRAIARRDHLTHIVGSEAKPALDVHVVVVVRIRVRVGVGVRVQQEGRHAWEFNARGFLEPKAGGALDKRFYFAARQLERAWVFGVELASVSGHATALP